MLVSISSLRQYFVLGRCPRCMRAAFLTAFFAWIVAAGALWFVPGPVAIALSAAALLPTALWVAHLAAYGWRLSHAPLAMGCGSANVLAYEGAAPHSRRDAVATFCKWVAFAALATAIHPSVAVAAGRMLAQNDGGCPQGYPLACPGSDTCCPAGTPYLCQNLQCKDPDGRVPVGWSGCVNPTNNEHLQWWSQCCAVWIQCG